MGRYVIIGGGVAGTTAADAIRSRDKDGRVTILTDEPYPLWSKIRLPELFSGSVDVEGLLIRKPKWYENRSIELRTEETVEAIDPANRQVRTSKGDEVPYDELLLATGGYPFVPPIPGAGKANVFTIRKLREAVEVRDRLTGLGRVVMIGGGTLGLEVARNLLDVVGEVHVVESHSRLLPKLTDPSASEMLHLRLDHMGIKILHECETKEISGNDLASEVVLEDGRRLACDAVVIATGMRAEKSLAEAIGLETERGVVVNDRMETSAPHIYAAGDVCEHRRTKYGSWRAAEEQGYHAGANMAGEELPYHGTVQSKYVRVAGADVFSAGELDIEGERESVLHVELDAMVYKKMVVDDCHLVGAIMVGDLRDAQRTLKAIEIGLDVCSHMEDLRNWDLGFVPRTVARRG